MLTSKLRPSSSNGGALSAVTVALLFLLSSLLPQPGSCLNFSYPSFPRDSIPDFIFQGQSWIVKEAIQVTMDVRGANITDLSGRVLYKRPFRLWRKGKDKTASFNSTFILNITPQTSPGGEGVAFVLAAVGSDIPANSHGQWLGITNATANGTALDGGGVVAVEFDTKKSFPEDLDGDHVGLGINSVYSILQLPLGPRGVNLSSGRNVTAEVLYDGGSKRMTVSAFMTPDNASTAARDSVRPILFNRSIDLRQHLPEAVHVGFSASTGESTELNCVVEWYFAGEDIGGDDSKKLLLVWILVPLIAALVLGGAAGYFFLRRRRNGSDAERDPEEDPEEEGGENEDPMLELEIQSSTRRPKKFRLKELKSATGDFSPKNELGKGGFGTVYKGVLSNNDRVVAVKRFSRRSEHGKADFVAEVKTIGNLHHRNLVKLVGWCHERQELLLVYEYMPNGSLDKFIFPSGGKGSAAAAEETRRTLDWETRRSVIGGVASALDYLHNGCDKRVLHRDIKASNILLDSEFAARLGDFGLARTMQMSDQTHHSTKEIAGTPGYMAPESFHTGRATAETDVYAFGVLVLEVVCGKKPGFQHEANNFSNGIVDWVWERHQRASVTEVVDLRLREEENFEREEAERALALGLACCHPNPYRRPSIRTAMQVLSGEAEPPMIPVEKPAFMWPVSAPPSFDYDPESPLTGGQLVPSAILTAR